jgi:serine/threonine protein kinase
LSEKSQVLNRELRERFYLTGVDIWAVGCIAVEMFTKQYLFPIQKFVSD